ncbi:MAG: HEPN domain-containing protein [Methanobrevibacter olleyae]|uniref:HEPN domain-containing protein n=1 Tax=Methanobrevibacter olleyae TaxID=294671 RepID=A0A8T3VY64_METOL|nr:HEPN domain-containing protein [Methanobrevibacter olleyae]
MGEFEEYIKKVNDKVISSKALFDIGQYATSVSASYYAMFLTTNAFLINS